MECRNTQVNYEMVFLFEMVEMIMFASKERLIKKPHTLENTAFLYD